ncbi:TetR/AcrR family transcriptional regulator [Nonomuraea roseoviolacea]|uniref:AcrR family transcriptional regulator n=1 Tax=Nonomuraea roseoviolacea subsp. carminata TaxID=160689 RepID=A0ABT1JSL5_9ACTN|nr:TetR/AcrR family transcriptional regulator [Nonomuraea roseoviolacea]MCP2344745.1 AcrR family transcriptional regulator [Nonomuraea roseoviolacea subsp. carminata]
MVRTGRPPQDPASRLERAHRILDAAAELILRWGYDKTTIDDVARGAGVAKGTIYLHWKTREALFSALLRRDRVGMLEEVAAAAPATLRELVRELAAGLLRRPLMTALMTGDSEVLGKLVRQKRLGAADASQVLAGQLAAFEGYLAVLGRHGALRPGPTPEERVSVLSAVLYGFLMTRGMLPPGSEPAEERLPALIAETVDLAIGSGTPLEDEGARAVRQATAGYLAGMREIALTKLAASLDVPLETMDAVTGAEGSRA